MTYAKISEVNIGTVLIADGGFTCLKEGAERKVAAMLDGTLFVSCREGGHTLDGQIEGDEYIGFTIK